MKTLTVPYELLHDIGSYLYTVKPPEYPRDDPEHNADTWRLRMLEDVLDLLFSEFGTNGDLN